LEGIFIKTFAHSKTFFHFQAMDSAGSNTYGYDDNGNQTTRVIGGQTVTLGYDAENRLVSVTGTNLSAQFTYNGDGQRVKSVINGVTIYFVGGYYEFNDATDEVSKYYFAGASRIAVRKYTVPQTTTLTYLVSTGSTQRLGDHASTLLSTSLGSTSLAVDAC
jgi:YD repeat-containing protein